MLWGMCYFFDSIDFLCVHLHPTDVYSFEWMERKLKERGMTAYYTRIGCDRKTHILGSEVVIIASDEGRVLSLKEHRLDEMCPDVSEWLEQCMTDDDSLFLNISDWSQAQ